MDPGADDDGDSADGEGSGGGGSTTASGSSEGGDEGMTTGGGSGTSGASGTTSGSSGLTSGASGTTSTTGATDTMGASTTTITTGADTAGTSTTGATTGGGVCTPFQNACMGNTAVVCKADGTGYEPGGVACEGSGRLCDPGTGTCVTGTEAIIGWKTDAASNMATFLSDDTIRGPRVTITSPSLVKKLGLYTYDPGKDMRMAVYSDAGGGVPSQLTALTDVFNTLDGYNELDVQALGYLAPGDYWIMAYSQSPGVAIRTYSPGVNIGYAPSAFPGPPAQVLAGAASSQGSNHWAVYAVVDEL